MPASMIHLLFANKIKPNGSALFYLSNIAPDAVPDWHDKDVTHFRDLNDRQPALLSLAKKSAGDYAEGVLLHLYFDWKWDTTVRQKFIDKIDGEWFLPYRNELSHTGSYAFHHTPWAKQIWNDMDSLDSSLYGKTPRASAADVKHFVSRNHKWHTDHIMSASAAFPPELIDSFISETAIEYVKWRKTI